MHIKIVQKLQPFSHRPGTYVILPGSPYRLRVFPARLEVDDLSSATPKPIAAIDLDIKGIVDEFTVMQDLERGLVRVHGRGVNGYFRYGVSARVGGKVALNVEKFPQPIPDCAFNDHFEFVEGTERIPTDHMSRLSLGNHRAQDWELMSRKGDLTAIFPIWHRLGQFYSALPIHFEGTAFLLNECRQAIEANTPEHTLRAFYALFLVGFEGALSPRLWDTHFHGIALPEVEKPQELSPLVLLQRGGELIQSLFIQEKEGAIDLLPAVPPEFHCGRLVNVAVQNGKIDLEWTKKAIRRVVFTAEITGCLVLRFSNHEKSCRLRLSDKDPGSLYVPGSSLDVVAGQTYWFDHFQC